MNEILRRIKTLEEMVKPPEPMMFLISIDDDGKEEWVDIDGFEEYFNHGLDKGIVVCPMRTQGVNYDDFGRYLDMTKAGACKVMGGGNEA